MVNKGLKIAFEAGEIIGGGLLLASGIGEVAAVAGLGAEAIAGYEAVATVEEAGLEMATIGEDVVNLSPEVEEVYVNENTPLLEDNTATTVIDQSTFWQNATTAGSVIGKTVAGGGLVGSAAYAVSNGNNGDITTEEPEPTPGPTPTPVPSPLPPPPDIKPTDVNLYGGSFQVPSNLTSGPFLMQDYPRTVTSKTTWV